MNKNINIAIDGYSSTGKSTAAKRLARNLGYRYIDSGAMYRAVTLYAIEHGYIDADHFDVDTLNNSLGDIQVDFKVEDDGRQTTLLNGVGVESEIREMRVSAFVSVVAAQPMVRSAMVALQQRLGEAGGIVMDGRDIGTTVFPNAQLKIFMTASPEIRARRRFDELTAKGESVTMEEVLENLRERDFLDETREVSPLRRADDAVLVDNSHLSLESQDDLLLSLARERMRTV